MNSRDVIDRAIDDARHVPQDRYPMWRHDDGRILRATEFTIVVGCLHTTPPAQIRDAIRAKLAATCNGILQQAKGLGGPGHLRVTHREQVVVERYDHLPSLNPGRVGLFTAVITEVPFRQVYAPHTVTWMQDDGWRLHHATHEEWFGDAAPAPNIVQRVDTGHGLPNAALRHAFRT